MDLKSGFPFWSTRDGLIAVYPPLRSSMTADVVVIGAGITGSLIADALAAAGQTVIVLDRREVCWGSTSASTALLQYEIDTPLTELSKLCGETDALAAYQGCLAAIDQVRRISESLDGAGRFESKSSLYFASTSKEVPDLKDEFDLRRSHQFPVEWWDAARLQRETRLDSAGAIMSRKAGQIDPYELAHALLKRVIEWGGHVFDRVDVVSQEPIDEGVLLKTDRGYELKARHVVIACGYESRHFLPRSVATLHSTFACISQPLDTTPDWPEDRCLMWETARPYLYLRSTSDGRLLAGGQDLPFKSVTLRDQALPARIGKVADRIRECFPKIPFEVEYSWAGTFAETPDGLPFIGTHPDRPGLLFALCYGGNGITYSVMAAEILTGLVTSGEHPRQHLFAFDRKSVRKTWSLFG